MSLRNTFVATLLGDSGCGKTSLIMRYVNNTFQLSLLTTVGIEYYTKDIEYKKEKFVLKIWDSTGQERFAKIVSQQLKKIDAAFVCFELGNAESFKRAETWIESIKNNSPEDVTVILVGTKYDLVENDSKFKDTDLIALAKKYSYKFFKTSAKNGEGVEEVFNEFISQVYKKRKKDYGEECVRSIYLMEEREERKGKSCC